MKYAAIILASLPLLGACAISVDSISVTNDDGSGFHYAVRIHGQSIREITVAAVESSTTSPGIVSASAVIFDDRNQNQRLDDGEFLTEFVFESDADRLARRVEWGPYRVPGSADEACVLFRVKADDREVTHFTALEFLLDF